MIGSGWIAVVMALGLMLSFCLSGMEAGVFALSRLRVRQRMRSGDERARLLHSYLERPENFLWTILVGNTLASFLVISLGVLVLHGWLLSRPWLFVLALLGVVFCFYTLGDLLPKMLFRTFPNRLCLLLVRPFRLLHVVLGPLVSLLEWFSTRLLRWTGGRTFTGRLFGSRDELRMVMQDTGETFTSDERAMINRVLDLQNITVGQIMLPLSRVVGVDQETPMEEVVRLSRERNFTRFPVWETVAGRRRIAGVLSLKSLLYEDGLERARRAGDYARPALYVGEEVRLEEALQKIQRSGQRLAVVLGRDGREAGIVTLQDILQRMFGEVVL